MNFDNVGNSIYIGPPVGDELIKQAERALGVRLPTSYLDLLRAQNGGTLRNRCLPTSFPTSWASDHICIDVILGVGGAWGIDLVSPRAIAEWEYPEIGVVFGITPSAGQDTVMLDYSECGPEGDPAVSYIDEDRIPRRVAGSFAEFLNGLVSCQAYGSEAD